MSIRPIAILVIVLASHATSLVFVHAQQEPGSVLRRHPGRGIRLLAAGRCQAAALSLPPAELRIAQTRFFSFALPPGWRVGEDGQFALTLVAPDNRR